MVKALRPEDQASLITFSHRVTSVVPMGHDRSAINDAAGDAVRRRRHRASRCGVPGSRHRLRRSFARVTVAVQRRTRHGEFSDRGHRPRVGEAQQRGRACRALSAGRLSRSPRADHRRTELVGAIRSTVGGAVRTRAGRDARALSADLLTVRSQKPGWHQIKVSLKGARGDVIAKQGYFVP